MPKHLRHWLLGLAFLLASIAPASAQQFGCLPSVGVFTAIQEQGFINGALHLLRTNNAGGTAPTDDCAATTQQGELWLYTGVAPHPFGIYDATQFLWLGYVDGVNHIWLPQMGGGLATLTAAPLTDLCASVPQNYLTINAGGPITSFGSSCPVGSFKFLSFAGAVTITANPSSILTDNGASISAANGDQATALYLGGGLWRILNYRSAAGPQFFSAGLAGGTAAAITLGQVQPGGFATALGVHLTFVAANNSNGPTTLQVAGGAAISIKKLTPSGLADLVAGDILANQAVSLFDDGTYWELLTQTAVPQHHLDWFHLSSCPIGWQVADGTNGTIDGRGRFLRDYDPGTGRDTTGTAVGGSEADQVGPMTIHGPLNDGSFAYAGGQGTQPSITPNNSQALTCTTCGNETRPKALVALLCEHL